MGAKRLLMRKLREILRLKYERRMGHRAIARACGVELAEDVVDKMVEATRGLGPITSSMRHDWEAGKPIEVHALSGVVVDRGRAQGVPTPVNATLYAALRLMEQAREME